ncbi:hypothetical protein, partial [Nocardia lijiangensis]|uniref:hypothetical protein n=1 Tax=Nocardia lijiangensis TaxID=299618 RepID=UPI0012DC9734
MKLLNVDAGALRKLVDACQAFVADILGLIESSGRDFVVLEWVYDNKKDGSHGKVRPTVTTLSSMGLLFEKFDRKRTLELVDVLRNHQAIVTVMANTFHEAQKSYSSTDDDNAGMFRVPGAGTDH